MTMEKVISYIGTNRGNGRENRMQRLDELLKRLGNPHKNLPYIHITGSNGKGSTAALFQSVLRAANLKVGLFTSPHLERVNERIRINNNYIKDEDFIRLINKIEPVLLKLEAEWEEKFYAFEILTVLSFLYFQEHQPDIIILEAGIGGKMDSTNIIKKSELSVITSIGLDHMKVLGDSIESVMEQKVQILKNNGEMVIGPVDSKLQKIGLGWAKKVNGSIRFVQKNEMKAVQLINNHQKFDYKSYRGVEIPLIGYHQIENASLVIEGSEILIEKGYPINREIIYKGLANAYWPGRFEKISEAPLFYIDGAHNIASVDRLVETLEEFFPNQKFHFVVGMMEDKEYEKMLAQVYPLAKEIILISPDPNRGFDIKKVAELIKLQNIQVETMNNIDELLTYIREEINRNEIVIQFGSLYLVGALKEEQSKFKHIQS